jgi:hypothetical protein
MQSLQEAKDKRMKKIAVGGAVLLAVVLAYQVPHMLGGGSKTAAPATTGTTTTATDASAPTTATPASTPAGTAAAASLPTTGSTKLVNSDAPPRGSKSQLVSFSHFAGKDPFVQQVSAGTALPTPSTSTTSAPQPGVTASIHSTAGRSTSSKKASARTLAKVGAAVISVNGRPESVRLGASFPSSNPLFRLISVTNGVARIGIANGSYTSGAQTVSLATGRTLTLVDTADGIRYKLRLVSGA